jgi:hypothetical protein
MKTIVIGFSRPKGWKPYAAAIMWVDKIDYDHGYMRFDSPRWDCSFIYQSSHSRTNFMGGEYFFKENIAVEEYELVVADSAEAFMGNLMVSREGLPYAVKQVIGKGIAAILFIASFGKIKISNPFKGGDMRTDCIEEVALILSRACGVEVPLDMNTITVKPFRDFIASLPNVKRIK